MRVEQLIEISLRSSGLGPDELLAPTRKIQAHLKQSEAVLEASLSPREKAEGLLRYMHDELLTRYVLPQTKVDTLLERGTFNCVSSALMYMILTRYYGIPSRGILTPDHAFVVVFPGTAEAVDVETTSPWGFDPGSKKEFASDFTGTTGYAYVPPGEYSNREEIGDKDMAGLIFQNLIVEAQKRGDHQRALLLGADRLSLVDSPQARRDYYSTIQNRLAGMNQQKQFRQGLELLETLEAGGMELSPFLQDTRSQLVYNEVVTQVNQGKIEEAKRGFQEWENLLDLGKRQELIGYISIKDFEARGEGEFSMDYIEELQQAAGKGLISQDQAMNLGSFHFNKRANFLSRQGKNKEAYLHLLQAPDWVRRDREYQRILKIVKNNTAIDYHNQVVSLLNQGQKKEAAAMVQEGLRLLPDSKLLLQAHKRYFQD